jgi:hypothetical protein
MNELVSNAQSAFIKKRSIHGNFLYVKNLGTRFKKSKIPALLFKLDICKAFDSVGNIFLPYCKREASFRASGIGLSLCSPS